MKSGISLKDGVLAVYWVSPIGPCSSAAFDLCFWKSLLTTFSRRICRWSWCGRMITPHVRVANGADRRAGSARHESGFITHALSTGNIVRLFQHRRISQRHRHHRELFLSTSLFPTVSGCSDPPRARCVLLHILCHPRVSSPRLSFLTFAIPRCVCHPPTASITSVSLYIPPSLFLVHMLYPQYTHLYFASSLRLLRVKDISANSSQDSPLLYTRE